MSNDAVKRDSKSKEVIDMREDEVIDLNVMAEYLRDKIEGADAPLEIKQFPGGHANLTYLLRFGDKEFVLRRPPLGPVAPKSHDMGREFAALSVLYKVYPYAPRAFVYCEDHSIIGAPFFVMERKKGVVIRNMIPPEFGDGEDDEKNRKISEVLVDALAELHQVDYKSVGLETLGKPDGFMLRQVEGWAGRFERAKTGEIEGMYELIKWLQDNLPEPPASTILHNDWRLDNIMLDSNDPGKVVGVFDWDMCTLGDPLADLGCMFTLWTDKGEASGMGGGMPTQVEGFMTRKEAAKRYSEKTGFDISDMDYYYSFGLYKIAIVLQQIYYRYHVGQTKDPRFQIFGAVAEMMIQRAFENTKKSIF